MVDSSSVFDFEGTPKPNIQNIMGVLLTILMIADIGFTSFRTGNLGALVTGLLFVITVVAAFGFIDNLLLTEGNMFDPSLGFVLGLLALNIGNLLANIKLSLLASATSSYLSGILGADSGILIPLVNTVFAPHGESFLIFGFAAGIYSIVKRTTLKDQSLLIQFFIVSIPPSLMFSVLHGARALSFFMLAFSINMIWTGILFYGELSDINLDLVPVSLSLIIGLHMGFNVSNSGGIVNFINTMISGLSGSYSRSAALVLVYLSLSIIFASYRVYQIIDERGLIH